MIASPARSTAKPLVRVPSSWSDAGVTSADVSAQGRSAPWLAAVSLALNLFAICCLALLWPALQLSDATGFAVLVLGGLATLGALGLAISAVVSRGRTGWGGALMAIGSLGLSVLLGLAFVAIGVLAWLLGQHIKF